MKIDWSKQTNGLHQATFPQLLEHMPDVAEVLRTFPEDVNDSYCECCGERWSTWVDESDLTDEPSYYETPLKEELDTFNSDGYATLHFHNGEVRYVKNHYGEYAELEVCPEEML